jgi:adenylate kinase family enzyme
MKKIMIIGSGGAGKSTLSRQMGEILNMPVIHLDSIYWNHGWEPTPTEEWEARQRQAISGDTWIVDGNYRSSMHLRLDACDTVIFLDFPRLICLYNVVKRYFQYKGKTRPDLSPGCPEQLSLEFLQWIWNFPKRTTPNLMGKLENLPDDKKIVILKSPKAVKSFLETIKQESKWK